MTRGRGWPWSFFTTRVSAEHRGASNSRPSRPGCNRIAVSRLDVLLPKYASIAWASHWRGGARPDCAHGRANGWRRGGLFDELLGIHLGIDEDYKDIPDRQFQLLQLSQAFHPIDHHAQAEVVCADPVCGIEQLRDQCLLHTLAQEISLIILEQPVAIQTIIGGGEATARMPPGLFRSCRAPSLTVCRALAAATPRRSSLRWLRAPAGRCSGIVHQSSPPQSWICPGRRN